MDDKPEELVENKKRGSADGDSGEKKPKKSRTSMAEFKGEFRQIKWPTRKELRRQIITTIITCIIVVGAIFVMDYVVSFSLRGAGQLLGVEEFDFFGQLDFGDFDFGDFEFEDDLFFEDLEGSQIEIFPDETVLEEVPSEEILDEDVPSEELLEEGENGE